MRISENGGVNCGDDGALGSAVWELIAHDEEDVLLSDIRMNLNLRQFLRRGFTLLEVMIAVGILFMCLFAVLALTSNSLVSARKIQQHRDLDAGTFAGYFYVQLAYTNRIDEGPADIDMGDTFPGYKIAIDCALAGTNGLWDVEYRVAEPTLHAEVHGHFFVYNPNSQQPGISRNLPTHR